MPQSAIATIAADSKYWLWINGELAVFEGGLKRGPTPKDTYYDEVDIARHLKRGRNTIAMLVWYWGKSGFSHKNGGKGGLLFEAQIDKTAVVSDKTWKIKVHPAYGTTKEPNPNFRLAEHNIKFDARRNSIAGWQQRDYDDSLWAAAREKGVPPTAPWNNLWKRPIPQWRNSGLVGYANDDSFPRHGTNSAVIAKLPYNAQITPYLKIEAPAGLMIDLRTDNYTGGGGNNVRAEYITKDGEQEFEALGWMNGHEVRYTIPAGVKILALRYRETGYDAAFAGSFTCNDGFYNTLWEKAKRTLYVNMRDNYMDCPDRERAQWWGDAVIELGETFYALDAGSHALAKKAVSNLVEWQKSDSTLYSPVPTGNWKKELPQQMLAAIGVYGFWTYYMFTGDEAAIFDAYDHVKRYLRLWELDADGLVVHRRGGWDWADWGSNIDARVLDNAWYYMALKAAENMAVLTGKIDDIQEYRTRIMSIEKNFSRVFWNGAEYRSPGRTGDTDDRANGLAVVAGLADPEKWPAIRLVLKNHQNASPYMEKYVLEALFIMGFQEDALARMKRRYIDMVTDPACSTLWEMWTKNGASTYNHAWAGGPLILLSQYASGVAPETAGFDTYHVFPREGALTSINTVVPSIKGDIRVSIRKNHPRYTLILASPPDTTAVAGIPKEPFSGMAVEKITVNGALVWQAGKYIGDVNGIIYNGADERYVKFEVKPGTWRFSAE